MVSNADSRRNRLDYETTIADLRDSQHIDVLSDRCMCRSACDFGLHRVHRLKVPQTSGFISLY